MNESENLTNTLNKVLTIIQAASAEVLTFYKNAAALQVQQKMDASPVTQADLASNNIIVSKLQEYFSTPILSEESVDDLQRLTSAKVWLVDPLDGTKEFIAQNGEFTINIALVENKRPILGVVAVPAQATIYYAIRNGGAFVRRYNQDKQIHSSNCNDIKEAKLSLSRSHLNPALKQLLEDNNVTNFVPKGSALKYCAIAEATSDASLRKTPLMEWDICAADCVLSEAGGKITDFTGQELKYNKQNPKFEQGIVASNSLLHQLFLMMVKKLI